MSRMTVVSKIYIKTQLHKIAILHNFVVFIFFPSTYCKSGKIQFTGFGKGRLMYTVKSS